MTEPVHRPAAPAAPIPGEHHYAGCDPDGPTVSPQGVCRGCGASACPVCGLDNCRCMRATWQPPRLEPGDANRIASMLARIVADLDDARAFLERREDNRIDCPAGCAAVLIASAVPELRDAVGWLRQETPERGRV